MKDHKYSLVPFYKPPGIPTVFRSDPFSHSHLIRVESVWWLNPRDGTVDSKYSIERWWDTCWREGVYCVTFLDLYFEITTDPFLPGTVRVKVDCRLVYCFLSCPLPVDRDLNWSDVWIWKVIYYVDNTLDMVDLLIKQVTNLKLNPWEKGSSFQGRW